MGNLAILEIAQGSLITKLSEVVRYDDIPATIERDRTVPRIGKVVADFARGSAPLRDTDMQLFEPVRFPLNTESTIN